LSGMLYAQEGRPLGTDCGTCAAVAKANNGARGRTLIQLLINIRRNRCTRIYTRVSRFGIGGEARQKRIRIEQSSGPYCQPCGNLLADRLPQRIQIKSSLGYKERGVLQPATLHQEFRVLRRELNFALRKKLLPANPWSGVEFPVRVRGLFRPHFVRWSEQRRIELHAQPHLRNIVRIITETGLRVYKELMSMKKHQLDLPNAVVWILDSKTPNGIA